MSGNGPGVIRPRWRKDLEQLVGPVKKITREEEIHLKLGVPPKTTSARGVVPRLRRQRMQPLELEPRIDPKGQPFYAKLRAEADSDLISTGKGKLYLGFHLDPFHQAHWNNLMKPLRFQLELPKGAQFDKESGEAAKVKVASDCDPREFLLKVENWPENEPVHLTVTYFACVEDKSCLAVRQSYVLHRRRDRDGGGARGEGAGYWDGEEFGRRLLARAKTHKDKLTKDEVMGLVRPHFEAFDKNKDGLLDLEELKAVADWLNHHHQPGEPTSKK